MIIIVINIIMYVITNFVQVINIAVIDKIDVAVTVIIHNIIVDNA